ncbi:MAG: HupE/UreJ family protein [Novosphingobium sp.]|nr:HupE/UreJ family protein [Novosphingobium sp.]
MALLLSSLALAFSFPVAADDLRPGYLEFTQRNAENWALIWKVPVAAGIAFEARPVLPSGCKASGEPQRDMAERALVLRYAVACKDSVAGKRIGLANFGAAETDVLVRVAPLDRPVQVYRLTAAEPSAEIRSRPGFWQVARTYFVTGVEHILFGYDHLLFVIALVLLLRGAWTVTKAVTAFTVAHSLTLIGTTLGLFGLPQEPVEALIALSIIFLAVEIVKSGEGRIGLAERAPWIVAFVFGLLHGFGFAGALHEIGLPEGDVPTALLSFNIGVEAGQLLIVIACLGALQALRRISVAALAPATKMASYGIGSVASYWLIERLI